MCVDYVLATAVDVLAAADIPQDIRDTTLLRLRRGTLTKSRLQLMFAYKTTFEAAGDRSIPPALCDWIAAPACASVSRALPADSEEFPRFN